MALQPLEVRRLDDFETAFETAKRGDAQALLAFDDPLHMQGIHRIVDLAASNRLPAMYPNREFPVYGGLMSYGLNVVVLFRRAATFVDKILKGRQARRPPGRAAHEVRAGDQPQDRQGAWPHSAARAARPADEVIE